MPLSPFARGRRDQGNDPLDRAPFLALLEPELRQRVRKHLNRRRVSAGEALFRQGDVADSVYLIEHGRMSRVFIGAPPSPAARSSQLHVLGFFGPGEIVGEAAFMAEIPQATTAEAVEDASVLALSRADFDALLGTHDGLLRYLVSLVAEHQAQANARLAAETAPDDARALRGFVTAVYSPRGGAGVTTLALNLAIALAERHPDDTVLLDLDVLFGHALANLWLEPRGVLAQVSPVTIRALDRAGLNYYLLPHSSSLRIFPAATRPEEGQTITGEHVRAAVLALRRHFAHIVLDLPHGFGEVTLAGLELANRVLLVATPEQIMLKDLAECQRIFADVLRLPMDHVSYVLNHPQPYTALPLSVFQATTSPPPGQGGGADAVGRRAARRVAASRCHAARTTPSRTAARETCSLGTPESPRRSKPRRCCGSIGVALRSGMLQVPVSRIRN